MYPTYTFQLHASPPLCMRCKHFSPPAAGQGDITNGVCLRYVTRNLVQGKLEYFYADEAREKVCIAGKDYEARSG